jgi:hypothetical protein
MAQMSQQYWDQTSPLRDAMISDYMGFLRPGGGTYSAPSYSTTGGTTGATTTGSNTGGITLTPYQESLGWDLWGMGEPTKLGSGNYYGNQYVEPQHGKAQYYPTITELTGMDANSLFAKYGQAPQHYLPGEGMAISGGTNPEYTAWLNNIITDEKIKRAVNTAQQAQLGQQTQTGGTTTTTPAGFTNRNLYNPYNLPGYAPLYQLAKTGLESQYNPARQAIMESTPRGGALYENLANLEMGRAQQAGSLPATIAAPLISDIMNKAYGVAFNSPQTSIAGLGAASNSWNQAQGLSANAGLQSALLNRQAAASTASGLGSLAALGVAGAGGLGGKSPFKGATATGGFS